jgi:hypothetical protein
MLLLINQRAQNGQPVSMHVLGNLVQVSLLAYGQGLLETQKSVADQRQLGGRSGYHEPVGVE